jgi:nucleotide-binding universal stress UspA family protein
MNTATHGRIVIGVDGSGHAGRALRWAVDQALLEHRGLTLVHVISPSDAALLAPDDDSHAMAGLPEATREVVARAHADVARKAPDLDVTDLVRVGDPREVLIDASRDAALVVLGSRGRGRLRSLLLGSVSAAVSQHAACPVIVHRPGNPGIVRNGVLVGVDQSERSLPVLAFAFRIAAQRDLPLTILNCYSEVLVPAGPVVTVLPPADVEDQRRGLAEVVAGFAEHYPEVRTQIEVSRGVPAVDLAHRAEKMNLLVVGAHHGGVAGVVLFGSVSTGALEHATCPVAVVPV